MPPRSYAVVAILLAALVAGGVPDRLGYSVWVWYSLFDIGFCLLTVPGALRIASGLQARPWVGIALASPGLVSGFTGLYKLANKPLTPLPSGSSELGYIALLAAAAAAMSLAEKLSRPRSVFRFGYSILAIAAITTCLNWLSRPMGWLFTQHFEYALLASAANTAAIFVKYGAFIVAAILIVIRRDIERWTGVVISSISAYLLYLSLRPLFVEDRFTYHVGWTFWLWPGVILISGAAIWRMGSLLHSVPIPEQPSIVGAIKTPSVVPPPILPTTRPLVPKGIAIYFGVLAALTFIAFLRDAITVATMLFIIPGLILIAAPTLLYYSIAALPAYFINRYWENRAVAVTIAVVSLASAAVLPHYVSWYLLERIVASDHSDPPSSMQPRSFELPYPETGNNWMNWHQPESHLTNPPPPCEDLCQQLLFKGNVDQVVIREPSTPWNDGTIRILGGTLYRGGGVYRLDRDGKMQTTAPVVQKLPPATLSPPRLRRFRLQKQETCPDTLSLIEGQFNREVAAGRCLIEDYIDSADADVVLSIVKAPLVPTPRQAGPSIALDDVQTGPMTAALFERHGQHVASAEVKTGLEARYAPLPFYFSPKASGMSLNLVAATDRFPSSSADPFEMISRRYNLPISPTPWATRFAASVSEDDRSTVFAILNRDYGPGGHILMAPSQLVASFVNARLKSGQLNQDDIELMRVLLKQRAFTARIETRLPASTDQALKPLLPEIFERISDRSDGQNEMVQSLNAIVASVPSKDTDPYLSTLCSDPKNSDLRVCYKRELRLRKE